MHSDTSDDSPPQERELYTDDEVRHGLKIILRSFIFLSAFTAMTTGAVLTSFLTKYLKVDDLWYGIILAAGPGAVFVQFWASLSAERSGALKPKYIRACSVQRVLWLGMAAIPLFGDSLSRQSVTLLVVAFVFLIAAFQHYGGGGSLAWIAALVPPSKSGSYFGYRQRVGMIAMLVTTVVLARVLDRYADSGWVYVSIFITAAAFGIVDIILLRRVVEFPMPTSDTRPTFTDVVRMPWRNPVFRSYALYAAAAGIATFMLDPFLWKYCLQPRDSSGLGMSVSMANISLFIIPTLFIALSAPHWGEVIDRYGPKPVLTACMVGMIVAPLAWLAMRPALIWLVPVAMALTALCTAGLNQVDISMRISVLPEQRRPSYYSALNAVIGASAMAGTTLGGLMASLWGGWMGGLALPSWISHYHPLFLTAILLRLAVLLLVVRRLALPGTATGGQVFRTAITEAFTSLPLLNRLFRKNKYPDNIWG